LWAGSNHSKSNPHAAKFVIEYLPFPHHRNPSAHFTDDPIEAEDFLVHLLTSRARITAIRHEGTVLPLQAADRMIKVAADRLASLLLQQALLLDNVQVKDRFGFAA